MSDLTNQISGQNRPLLERLRASRLGQSMMEFAVCVTILSIFVFGAIQYGHMISIWTRLAAVVREGGRAHVALNYSKDEYPTEAINIMQDMIKPGDVKANGAICFSVIRREGTGASTDKMVIVGQHYFNESGVTFASKLGSVGTEVSTSIVPLDMVTVEQTLVAVEVLYDFSRDHITPVNAFLELGNFNEAYERAFF